MPEMNVNGVTLAYEVYGKGPSVVWSTQGGGARDKLAYLIAGRLSANYRVLIWDRRNSSGASDVAIEDASSDHDLWSRDLHGLLEALDMSPAYLAGACSGASLSLLMAHRNPMDVRALILVSPPTDDVGLTWPIADASAFKHAAVAKEKGMEAVIAHSMEAWQRVAAARSSPGGWDGILKWVAETISMNPGNRDRLLAMDPKVFAAIMRRWGNWYQAGPGHVHGLSYEYVRPITLPALVAHGFDPVHPRDTAEKLCRVLPNAEWVEYSDRYTQDEIDQAGQKWALALPFMEAFLGRIEAL